MGGRVTLLSLPLGAGRVFSQVAAGRLLWFAQHGVSCSLLRCVTAVCSTQGVACCCRQAACRCMHLAAAGGLPGMNHHPAASRCAVQADEAAVAQGGQDASYRCVLWAYAPLQVAALAAACHVLWCAVGCLGGGAVAMAGSQLLHHSCATHAQLLDCRCHQAVLAVPRGRSTSAIAPAAFIGATLSAGVSGGILFTAAHELVSSVLVESSAGLVRRAVGRRWDPAACCCSTACAPHLADSGTGAGPC